MLSLLLVLLCGGLVAADFYVSPDGDDSAAGTQAAPFRTPARAALAVRGVNSALTADLHVYLRGGAYYLPSALSLGLADGGSGGYFVRWSAYPGETPVLHKGAAVTGWAVHDAAKNIWSAPLPAGVADARQAYVNGARMNSTNTGSGLPAGWAVTSYGYSTTTPLTAWTAPPEQNAADLEFLYTGDGSSWTECRLRVAAITGGAMNVTMQEPGFTLGRNRYYGQAIKTPRSVANVYALLGAGTPGQGYINSATRTIYYVPRAGEDMATAQVLVPSGDEALLTVQGDLAGAAPQRVSGLAFEGLTFSYAGWLDPNSGLGYVTMQSGFRVLPNSTVNDVTWAPVPGNVAMHTVGAVRVTGCSFQHLGATALLIDGGSQDVLVQNNTFRDVSAGGVYFGNVNDLNVTAEEADAHFVIDSNLFDGIPVEFRDGAPICGGFVLNVSITHNSILNNANTGISLGWGWSRDEASNSGYANISYNYVFGSNWLLEDGGSIYVLGPQPQSVMSYNYISSQHKLYGALYTDEGSAYWLITKNVVHNVPEWLHIWTASIHDEVVVENWSDQTYQQNAGTRITEANNTFITPGQPFPAEAQVIMANAGTPAMAGPKP